MRHDKLERELNLLMLLTENHNYTVPDICESIGISRRNLYYYLDFFRDAGFIVRAQSARAVGFDYAVFFCDQNGAGIADHVHVRRQHQGTF